MILNNISRIRHDLENQTYEDSPFIKRKINEILDFIEKDKEIILPYLMYLSDLNDTISLGLSWHNPEYISGKSYLILFDNDKGQLRFSISDKLQVISFRYRESEYTKILEEIKKFYSLKILASRNVTLAEYEFAISPSPSKFNN